MDTSGYLVVGLALGLVVGLVVARLLYDARLVGARTESALLRERIIDLEASAGDGAQAAAELGPLRDALVRVERQVGVLERDRVSQYASLGTALRQVTTSTEALREETASLAGSLKSSSIRGTWGESQLRRLLEHSGMLARCDFDEQVRAVAAHDVGIRPDVVVRLPRGKVLVIDAKAPLTAFLEAQAPSLGADERLALLGAHARALRGHVDALAAKAYWTAFAATPELVVCFVPGDAILASALQSDPALFERAAAGRVVLASPSTLFALLRTVALVWQQDALAANAQELHVLGKELYVRLSTLGQHATAMGTSLRRSVEAYNQLIGSLESRVLVTARRMHELDFAPQAPEAIEPLVVAPRPLTSAELTSAALTSAAPASAELASAELASAELAS